MLLDKALILKGAAGVTAVAGIAVGGVVFNNQAGSASSQDSQARTNVEGQSTGDIQSNTVKQPTETPRDSDGQPSGTGSEASRVRTDSLGTGGGVAPSTPVNTKKSETEKKKEKMDLVNKKLTDLGLGNCLFTEGEITNINDFSRECTLDQAKFQKIHFSNKGKDDVTVSGWSSNINLKIHNENNKTKYTFKNAGSKLTISGDPTKTNIVLKASGEREFEEKAGKLSKVSKATTQEKTKITKANQKLKMLKIPDQCRFEEEENDTSIECDVSDVNVLKKIDFLNKGKGADSKIVGSTSGLKMTINRLSDLDGSLKHITKRDIEFVFSGYSNEIKIQDNRTNAREASADIILAPNTNTHFTITDESSGTQGINRLAKGFNYYSLGFKLGLSCTGSSPKITCRPYGTNKKIRILNSDNTGIDEIDVQSKDENTTIITLTEDVKGYEQGIKFTVTQAFPTSPSSSPRLEKGNYQAKYIVGKGWGLVKKEN